MKIPSERKCLQLIRAMGTLSHIVDHCRQVRNVAVFLAEQLRGAGVELDCNLVQAGALLHDITKTRSLDTGEMHAQSGAEYLDQLGYPEVASIIGQHVCLRVYFSSAIPDEAEIVNYADKRVLEDRIVSLDDRMQYISDRYASSADDKRKMSILWRKSTEVERRIFSHLNFPPAALAKMLDLAS